MVVPIDENAVQSGTPKFVGIPFNEHALKKWTPEVVPSTSKPSGRPTKKPRTAKMFSDRLDQDKKVFPAVSFEDEFAGDISFEKDEEFDLFPHSSSSTMAANMPVARTTNPFDAVDKAAALTTLADAAKLASVFSPIVKDKTEHNVIRASAKKNAAVHFVMSSPAAVKMRVPADLAGVFTATPIKVTVPDYLDLRGVFGSNDVVDDVDETMSEYSLGSLSTPLKTAGEKSAFTPLTIADINHRLPSDFYEPIVEMTGSLLDAVDIDNGVIGNNMAV